MGCQDVVYGEFSPSARFEIISIYDNGLWDTFASCNEYKDAVAIVDHATGKNLEIRDRWAEHLELVKEADGFSGCRLSTKSPVSLTLLKVGLVDLSFVMTNRGGQINYLKMNKVGLGFIREAKKLSRIGRG